MHPYIMKLTLFLSCFQNWQLVTFFSAQKLCLNTINTVQVCPFSALIGLCKTNRARLGLEWTGRPLDTSGNEYLGKYCRWWGMHSSNTYCTALQWWDAFQTDCCLLILLFHPLHPISRSMCSWCGWNKNASLLFVWRHGEHSFADGIHRLA